MCCWCNIRLEKRIVKIPASVSLFPNSLQQSGCFPGKHRTHNQVDGSHVGAHEVTHFRCFLLLGEIPDMAIPTTWISAATINPIGWHFGHAREAPRRQQQRRVQQSYCSSSSCQRPGVKPHTCGAGGSGEEEVAGASWQSFFVPCRQLASQWCATKGDRRRRCHVARHQRSSRERSGHQSVAAQEWGDSGEMLLWLQN